MFKFKFNNNNKPSSMMLVFIGFLYLGLLALSIFYFMGLTYTTTNLFKGKIEDGKVVINTNKFQLDVMKLFVVLTWISLIISLVAVFYPKKK